MASDFTFSTAPDDWAFTVTGSSRISLEEMASRGAAWRGFPTLCVGAIVRVVVSVTFCSDELGFPVDAWATAVTQTKQAAKPKNTDLMCREVGTTATTLY